MFKILSKILSFVKPRFYDIMIFIIVVLLIMLAFASGFLTAKYYLKTPIQIETQQK